ncbi:MAG: electron transfer flavoprotein-quinone oxidoreductase [Bacillota bacterium]|nr:electron transfer flavoprotein-quinone oxidoreductase [Bacillota bacterium]
MGETYDAVVVGAGPAGSAAALVMAKNNLKVCLLERGETPGSKNMFGGTVYRLPTAELVPAFWEQAPLERPVVTEELWFLDDVSAVKFGFTALQFARPPYNKFTALRPAFDRWFADLAVRAGAKLYTSTLVQDIHWEKVGLTGRRAAGVVLEDGQVIEANAVILAEGAAAFLTQKAGLRRSIPPSQLVLYAREVLALPAATIEERFHLDPGEGAVLGFVGFPAGGIIGKGGIWTNRESVSIMVGGYVNQLQAAGYSLPALLVRFKAHPLIQRLIGGAESLEYQAHIIPKGGFDNIPQLVAPGILVAGDAALMISGRRGSDLALLTGQYAGEAVVQAHAKRDFSVATLSAYERRIQESFFLSDIKASRHAHTYYATHSDADLLLTKALNSTMLEFFRVDMETHKEKRQRIITKLKSMQSPAKTLRDLWAGLNNWGVF